ncbi:MAG TPA: RraA family protein [Stellaceae bacterium]|nr:RraA family protein [Stellaceae bacterium]
MSDTLTEAELEALRAWDTPTICNALELVAPERRALGFNRRPLYAPFPELKPVVGYARTAMIRAREPYGRAKEEARRHRIAYYEYIAAPPRPTITVIQDVDGPDLGFGAFWGEVQTHLHQALGAVGVVTDGCVRDLDAMAKGFFVLAGSVMPSHAHVELVDFGGTVSVHGMVVRHDDLVHADRHGAVVIPHAVARQVPEAAALLARREKVLLDAAKRPGFSVAELRRALAEADEIH